MFVMCSVFQYSNTPTLQLKVEISSVTKRSLPWDESKPGSLGPDLYPSAFFLRPGNVSGNCDDDRSDDQAEAVLEIDTVQKIGQSESDKQDINILIHWELDPGYLMLKYMIQDTGSKMQDPRCKMHPA